MNHMPLRQRWSAGVLTIDSINVCLKAFVEAFSPPSPVVEIGSYYPPGYEAICDRRRFFAEGQYVGCDIRGGPGVDRIEDAHALTFETQSVGTVLLLEVLEHVPRPDLVMAEVRRVLRPDGLLMISMPFAYRLHAFPHDYRRLTGSGLYEMLSDFPERVVFSLGPRVQPRVVFAVAKPGRSSDFAARQERFQALLRAESGRLHRMTFLNVLQDRTRELLGLLLGRAHVEISFFDPRAVGGYEVERDSSPHVRSVMAMVVTLAGGSM
jgi:SAM-dependent methyltransferase